MAFKDINPVAKIHLILIPKVKDNLSKHINAEEKNKEILGYLMIKAAEIAKENKLEDGYRLVINNGKLGG